MGEREKPREWEVRQYYSQDELVEKVVEVSEYREIAPTYPEGYGKRPDAVNFPGDFLQLVENGAVAFHLSVEKWRNPLLLDEVDENDSIRRSWDLVIDIDCDYSFELAKETAVLVVEFLEGNGVENFGVKFSGNRGFHIGLSGESFPEKVNGEDLALQYPELPRKIIDYMRSELEDDMVEKVREYGFEEEMEADEGLNPYLVSDIENNWGDRHLFRMPYSLHDGSWLVSLPIGKDEIEDFEKEDARMDEVEFDQVFMPEPDQGEAEKLLVNVLDSDVDYSREEEDEERDRGDRDFQAPEDAIPDEYFPPTIENILEGLEDGRKRALFILINFFNCIGYSWDQIESRVRDWNKRNNQELPDSYVDSQLNWHRKRDEEVPPPNYDANGYYRDMKVYEGDNLEQKVSNPVSYVFAKYGDEEDRDEEERHECPYCGKEYKMEHYYREHVQKCFEH